MTPREKNLWGLIAGLVLAIAFGVYKASHSELVVPTESPSADSADEHFVEPGEMNADDAAALENEAAAFDAADGNPYNEGDYSDSEPIEAPQNLLPENATDAAAIDDQPDGGEE